jgi:Tol biopolymer transport system component
MYTRFSFILTVASCLVLPGAMLLGTLLPGAGQIAFAAPTAGDMNLYVLDVASRVTARITWGPGEESQPDWSPDGMALTYAALDADGPSIVTHSILCGDLLTACDRTPRRLTSGLNVSHPDWSPDGAWIAFQVADEGGSGQRLARLPAGCRAEDPACQPELLTLQEQANQLQPAWSPDGGWIAFAGDLDESFNTDLYMAPADCFQPCAGQVQRVFGGLTNDLFPQWSPDGRWLAFNYTMRSRMRVGLIDMVNGDGAQRVDIGFDWVEMPAWSPQGDVLALVIYRRQQGDLYLFRLDCEGDPRRCLTRLTRSRAVEVAPAWRPGS